MYLDMFFPITFKKLSQKQTPLLFILIAIWFHDKVKITLAEQVSKGYRRLIPRRMIFLLLQFQEVIDE